LKDGELEAYFDSDGAIKWAGGKGVADATGISHTEDANNYWKVKPGAAYFSEIVTQSSDATYIALRVVSTTNIAIQGESSSGSAVVGNSSSGSGVYGDSLSSYGVNGTSGSSWGVFGYSSTGIGAVGRSNGTGGIGVKASVSSPATTALQIDGGIVDGGSQRYTAMGNASADTDGLNRITADGRYLLSGAATTLTLNNATTNAVDAMFTLAHNSTGTAAAGFGSRMLWALESSTTADQTAATDDVAWVVATHASRTARRTLSVYDTAARECVRLEASGSAPLIGFLGANAAARVAHVADAKTDYTTGDLDSESEVIAALNTANGKINSILATLETFGFHAAA
jgi:hypothetical protein